MRLSQRLAIAYRAFVGQREVLSPFGLVEMTMQRDAPERGSEGYLKAYSTMPWLRAVTHRISTSTASVQWKLYAIKRQGRYRRMPDVQMASNGARAKLLTNYLGNSELEEITDHPMLTLLGHANPLLTGFATRKLTQIYLDLLGECGWLYQRNPAGVPESAWPIPPTWVEALPSSGSPSYRVSYGGWTGDIPVSEMLWFVDADPKNPYGRGSGTAKALADELDTDEYAAKMARNKFYNHARPDMIIAPRDAAAEINATSLERLKERWLQEHQGFWKVARPFFSSRAIDVHEISQNFEHLQFVELRKFERDMCIEVFGVPPEILGIIEASKKSTITEAETIYSKRVLIPRLELQRSFLQTRLVPEYDDRLIIDYVSPVPEDREFRLRAAQASPHTLTANEWRELQGHPPREDGDVFFVPFSIVSQPALDSAASPVQRQLPHPQGRALKSTLLRTKAPRYVDEEPDDEFYLVLHRIADRLEPGLRRALLGAFARMRDQTDMPALQAAIRSGRLETILQALPWEFLREELGATLADGLQQSLMAAGDATATHLETLLAVEVSFSQDDPRARGWIEQHALELASDEGLTGESRQAVRQLLQQALERETMPSDLEEQIMQNLGLTRQQQQRLDRFRQRLIDEGETGAELTRRTARYADALRNQRAETITRTELINAVSEGQHQAWQQADESGLIGDKMRRFWIVTPDDRLDPDCEGIPSRNRDGVGLQEPFQTPVGLRMRPTIHPNCRCSVSLRRVP